MSEFIEHGTHVSRSAKLTMDAIHAHVEAWPQPVSNHDPYYDAPIVGGSALSQLIDTGELTDVSDLHATAA